MALLLLPLLASLAAGAANGGSAEAAEALGWRAEPGEEAAGGVGVPASSGPNRALRRRGSSPRGAGAGLPPPPVPRGRPAARRSPLLASPADPATAGPAEGSLPAPRPASPSGGGG